MASRRQFLAALPAVGMAAASSAALDETRAADAPATDNRAPLRAAANGAFEFETSAFTGLIQPDGAYHGVTRLTDVRTGRQWIDERYSALNLFKLQSVNHFMGQPRDMPREVTSTGKSVQIRWPATDSHRGEVIATYEVHEPDVIEVTVAVRLENAYPGYEVFLSSYFDKATRSHVYLKQRFPDAPEQLVAPSVNDVFRDCLLVFPRDAHAARLCVDGRWDRSEGGVPVVQNVPVRHYARCLAFLAAPDRRSAVVLMANPRHAFGFSTRYHADRDEDRQTSYSAVDFSLCGENLAAGDERIVRVRMALTELDEHMSRPRALYEEFMQHPPVDSATD